MSRPTDFERGARLALYTADLNRIHRQLFPTTESEALDREWDGIYNAAEDALREAVACRQLVKELEAA
jgi:hypothetical protein